MSGRGGAAAASARQARSGAAAGMAMTVRTSASKRRNDAQGFILTFPDGTTWES